MITSLPGLISALLAFVIMLGAPLQGWAGPVDWVEVPQTEAGQQWWDRGSVRREAADVRSVLSRFTPAEIEGQPPGRGSLYVMQIDCAQGLYRDKQVNGIPRFRAEWEPAGGDGLIDSVIQAVCSEPLT